MVTVPLAGIPGTAEVVPEDTEPVLLSKPLDRGGVTWLEDDATSATPSVKTVDGDPSDWVGQASRLGGTTVLDQGELIYQDLLFDDFGADDGKDADRNQDLAPVYDAEPRTQRTEALTQAAGEQFGADDQDPTDGYLTGPANYGDAVYPDGTEGQADLVELRLAADEENLYLLARLAAMADEQVPVLYLLADTHPNTQPDPPQIRATCMGGLATESGDRLIGLSQDLVSQDVIVEHGTLCDQEATGIEVAVEADGRTNTLEASIPRDLIEAEEGEPGLAAAVAVRSPDDTYPWDQRPMNAAFREEPTVSNWFDKAQAMALHERTLDPFFREVDLDELASGTTVPWQPTPGYHSRIFLSDPAISEETLEQGPKETTWQHYGLYLPDAPTPEDGYPMTMWLHWRGGTAHQAAAWTPRVIEQLGEERDPANIVISPRGRGTSTWYTGAGHVDVLEAWDDVHDLLDIDEDRRYVSGYSMGGYGSYLFGLLYPDKFAGAYPISGAMTQGLWLGVDDQGRDTQEANGGDADVQNTYRLIENARNVPYVIHHGTDDELVPVTGVERVAARFAELGYQHRFYRFLGYEHYTQAVVDEWKEGARYLDTQTRDEDPARVVYKRIPALEHEIETQGARGADIDLDTDGAYWLTDLQPRTTDLEDPNIHAMADVTSLAHPEAHLNRPEAGAAAPGHSTPYVMDGLAWTSLACIPEAPCPALSTTENAVEATVTNAAQVDVDAERMAIDTTDATFELHLETDGAITFRVLGDWSCSGGQVSLFKQGAPATFHASEEALVLETQGAGTYIATIC